MRRSPSLTSASYGSRERTTLWQIASVDGPTPRARLGWTYPAMGTPRRRRSEAGSDPCGHLGVTWGVYLCAGKPPLADIILSHPPDLT